LARDAVAARRRRRRLLDAVQLGQAELTPRVQVDCLDGAVVVRRALGMLAHRGARREAPARARHGSLGGAAQPAGDVGRGVACLGGETARLRGERAGDGGCGADARLRDLLGDGDGRGAQCVDHVGDLVRIRD